MSSVLFPLIASVCLSLPTNTADLCNKSSQAFIQQTGIEQTVNEYEHLTEKYAESQAGALLRDDRVTGIAFVVNTAVTKSLRIKASPNVDLTANIYGRKYLLGFDWSY